VWGASVVMLGIPWLFAPCKLWNSNWNSTQISLTLSEISQKFCQWSVEFQWNSTICMGNVPRNPSMTPKLDATCQKHKNGMNCKQWHASLGPGLAHSVNPVNLSPLSTLVTSVNLVNFVNPISLVNLVNLVNCTLSTLSNLWTLSTLSTVLTVLTAQGVNNVNSVLTGVNMVLTGC